MTNLSVIIITKNEAANIRSCLESVAWADEIIVVDSGSSDATVEICRELGAKVFVHDWPGFGMQKNRALNYATQEWVFSIDADERVTPQLRAAIETVLRADSGTCAAYRISRLSSFCGRFMRHSGWHPDYIVRLFKRDMAHFSDNLVHESLLVKGKIGQLEGKLLHYTYDDVEEMLRKVNQYSTAGAAMMQQRGRQTTLTGAVLRGLWSFIRTYFLRAGFLDGREGFMLAVSNAEGTYYRYLKLLQLNKKNMMRIALIITTYNRPDALSAVLEGCLAQTDPDFEVIVADDGSTQITTDLIASYHARAPFTIKHIWQDDEGFRAAAVRNRALVATHADYIIFIDGDCVPSPEFVVSHRRLAERGWFLSGNRMMLTPVLTEKILHDKLPIHLWRKQEWLKARWHGQIERLLPLLQLPHLGWLRKLLPRRWQGAKTCNLSAWRDDLLRVNGLDESYTGWGLEDSDLVIRMLRAGIYNKSARFSVPVFHLWHRKSDRSNLKENHLRLQQVLQAKYIRAAQGVDQYL